MYIFEGTYGLFVTIYPSANKICSGKGFKHRSDSKRGKETHNDFKKVTHQRNRL